MKQIKSLFLPLTAIVFALFSCDKESGLETPPEPGEKTVVLFDSVTVTPFSASVFGNFATQFTDSEYKKANFGVLYIDSVIENTDIFNAWINGDKDPKIKSARGSRRGNIIEGKLSNLGIATTYSYCTYFINGETKVLGNHGTFTTNSFDPTVTTGDAFDITYYDAVLTGRAQEVQKSLDLCEIGIIYHTSQEQLKTAGTKSIVKSYKNNAEMNRLLDFKFNTQYFYCAYLKTPSGLFYYGDVKDFTTPDMAVDLGLSVKWAACNLGARQPEEYGNYYAWGETAPKTSYTWDTYDLQSRYNTDTTSTYVSSKDYIELKDDAANVNWGGTWRMPKSSELRELDSLCTIVPARKNGIAGFTITSKKNGNSIFAPAAGYMQGSTTSLSGSMWILFCSDLYFCSDAYGFWWWWYRIGQVEEPGMARWYGLPIRPVCSK